MRWTGNVDGRLEVGFRYKDGRFVPANHKLTGGPIVYVRRNVLDDEAPTRVFDVGPFLFYPLGMDYARDAIIAVHINGPLWWLAVLRYWASSIEPRILATLYVWGLADYPIERTQMWDDVYLVRRINERMHKD